MSVVARQGVKFAMIGYLGFLIGTASAVFVFPNDFRFYGHLRYIMLTAEMLLPFVLLGVHYSNVKFFPQVQLAGKKQNMLSLSGAFIFLNFILFSVLFLSLPYLYPPFEKTEMWNARYAILPLIFILAFSALLNKFTSNYKRIAVSNLLDNLLPKIANLGAFFMLVYIGFSQQWAYAYFFTIFSLMLLGYVFFTQRLEKIEPDFSWAYFKKDQLWRSFLHYSFFGFLGTFGNYLAINGYMIGEFLGMQENGIWSVLYALISLISIPQLGILNISAPIISELIAKNDTEELDQLHKKSSLSLYFIGTVLFSCIVIGFPFLTHFMPKNGLLLKEYEPVIWIWGIAVLFDLATGFNSHIISMSKYYRFNIFIMLLLSGVTIGLNWYFIHFTGLKLIGIAISTATSLTLYNITKIIFNWWKFRVFPLTIEMMYQTIICTLSITIVLLLPNFKLSFLNLVYKPFLILLLVAIGNHYTKIFPIKKYLNKNFVKSIFKF